MIELNQALIGHRDRANGAIAWKKSKECRNNVATLWGTNQEYGHIDKSIVSCPSVVGADQRPHCNQRHRRGHTGQVLELLLVNWLQAESGSQSLDNGQN